MLPTLAALSCFCSGLPEYDCNLQETIKLCLWKKTCRKPFVCFLQRTSQNEFLQICLKFIKLRFSLKFFMNCITIINPSTSYYTPQRQSISPRECTKECMVNLLYSVNLMLGKHQPKQSQPHLHRTVDVTSRMSKITFMMQQKSFSIIKTKLINLHSK